MNAHTIGVGAKVSTWGEFMRALRRTVCLSPALAVVAIGSLAFAEGSSRPYANGGRIQPLSIIQRYNKSGELFRIEGTCMSSCTMLLAIKNVCIESDANLMFHAALFKDERDQKPPPKRQAIMLGTYKPKLRQYLVSNHYVDTFEFHSISGSEMISKFGYRACPGR